MDDKHYSLGIRLQRPAALGLLRTAIAAVIVCSGIASLEGATGHRTCCPAAVRPQDTIWLVSTRNLGCAPRRSDCPTLCVLQYDRGAGWKETSAEGLCATDSPETITTVWVHGNRVDRGHALSHGMAAYRALAARATEETQLRHVIWSWPADKVAGPVRDGRAKAQRTESESYYLGCLLSKLAPDARVSLWGHSFGVRIITGSLHLLSGGSLSCRVLPVDDVDARMPMRVVTVAAAVDNNWLLPGCRHGLAVNLVDQILIFYNPCDPVLRRYRWVARERSQNALGFTGLIGAYRLGEAATRIDQINARPWIGKTHSLVDHLRSNALMHEIGRVALWE